MKKRIPRLIAALAAALLLVCCSADVDTSLPARVHGEPPTPLVGLLDPDSEIRGVWIATVYNIDFPSAPDLSADALRAEIDAIIDNCKRMDLNTVFFQVRPACDALYRSDIFPVSRFLSTSGKLTFDPLGYILEKAKRNEMFVYAWVNPLRAATSFSAAPVLPDGVTDDMTVEYDGKLVLDAGVPATRELVARGVYEIVERYDVDGVVFDDYFYPYPANDASGARIPFDDGGTYAKYGADFSSVADFRRDSVNRLVKECYDAVKRADPECVFGVSPFGVWRNSESVGGAGTAGFEAYDELYCDAPAWAKGGYVDFLAPQIYWQRSSAGTPYELLLDWWNASVGMGGVDLLVSHAAYRYEEGDWDSPAGEMREQVTLARQRLAYRGSVFYGYDELKNNVFGIRDELLDSFRDEIVYLDPASDGSSVTVTSFENYGSAPRGEIVLEGHSDPAYPLYLNGSPVGRRKNGDFSVRVTVSGGENRFLFTRRGEEFLFVLFG
ncbi:MAG: family 10 glycosylhydrolase [Clostridia bacterium]|nr:family 10 glycosylhydrolase [Clostridia bacterium]